jgi:hypothetical protein
MSTFFAVTQDNDADAGDQLEAHEFDTSAEAEAFAQGVRHVNDSAIFVVGTYQAVSDAQAVEFAKVDLAEVDRQLERTGYRRA